MTACPTAHTIEWDAQRGRITGIRFRLDDGSDVLVGAAVFDKPLQESADEDNECPHGDPDCMGGDEDNHWACERPFRERG